jgi:thiol:disulfide interchange protein DsbD
LPLAIAATAPAQFDSGKTTRQLTFEQVVTEIATKIEPAAARPGDTVTWRLTVELLPGWHTYPTKQTDPEAQQQVTKFTFPTDGDLKFDEKFSDPPGAITKAEPGANIDKLIMYEGKVVWERKAVVSASATSGTKIITVPVRIFACKESCLPPRTIKTQARFTVVDGTAAAPPTAANPPADPPSPGASAPGSDYSNALAALEGHVVGASAPRNTGLGAFLLTAVVWGLVSLATPCVFPMIPITVSFFLKQSEKQHLNPVLQALVYCGTIVIVLGVAALTLLGVFRELSVNPWTNIVLGGLFIVLALSLFGMYELTLPNALTRWSASREGKGGLVGTVFMALTFTIVSFTCVAPFLGGFAGIVASGQFHYWEMLLGALAFSGAFAAPFFLLALFPSALRKLPRSGGWLNSVKVVMGFLELAAALKFFRTAELRWSPEPAYFTYDFILGLWVALSLVCGLYLLNMFRLGHDEVQESIGVPRMLWGLCFLGLAFYVLPGIFRGPDGDRQRPGGVVFAWIDAFLLPDAARGGVAHDGLRWSADLPKAVADAKAAGKKIFVDFTGVTCTNCRYNERAVFSRPEVKALFDKYQLVQMYTDVVPAEFYSRPPAVAQREADALANLDFQRRKFGKEQLPLYVILDPQSDGKIVTVAVYEEGKINKVDKFVEFLQQPLAAETARAQR